MGKAIGHTVFALSTFRVHVYKSREVIALGLTALEDVVFHTHMCVLA
jgi:hypothetical protein